MHSRNAIWLISVLLPLVAGAHPELQYQIDQLNEKIQAEPDNPELYLQRGNLHRRHTDWAAAYADFYHVRELDPKSLDADWLEGSTRVDAGDYEQGEHLLNRYLEAVPDNAIALQSRARARSALGRHEAAAADYGHAIETSQHATPILFNYQALALAVSGREHFPEAMAVTAAALSRFPGEVSLLGVDTDMAIATGNSERAAARLAELPDGLEALPQWQFRRGLLDCLDGREAEAGAAFSRLHAQYTGAGAKRTGTWSFPLDWVAELSGDASPEACRRAVERAYTGSDLELP